MGFSSRRPAMALLATYMLLALTINAIDYVKADYRSAVSVDLVDVQLPNDPHYASVDLDVPLPNDRRYASVDLDVPLPNDRRYASVDLDVPLPNDRRYASVDLDVPLPNDRRYTSVDLDVPLPNDRRYASVDPTSSKRPYMHPGTLAEQKSFCDGRVRVSVNTTDLLSDHKCSGTGGPAAAAAQQLPGAGLRPMCTTGWAGRGYDVNLEEFQAFGAGEGPVGTVLARWRKEREGKESGEKNCDAWVELPTHTGDKVLLCAQCEEDKERHYDDDKVGRAPSAAPVGHGKQLLGREVADDAAELQRIRVQIKIKIKIQVRIFRRGPK